MGLTGTNLIIAVATEKHKGQKPQSRSGIGLARIHENKRGKPENVRTV